MALPIGVNLSRPSAIGRVRQGLKPLASGESPRYEDYIDISKKASIEQARCLFHNKRFKEFFSQEREDFSFETGNSFPGGLSG